MSGPGAMPKIALTASRLIYKPFHLPQRLTDSSYLVGQAGNSMVAGITGAIGNSYMSLQPKGPAKWLVPVLQKTMEATQNSQRIADRNKNVFWDPVSKGFDGIGTAIAGPGAYYYAKKAGAENPSDPALIHALLIGKGYPGGSGGASGAAGGAAGGQAGPADAAAAAAAAAQQQGPPQG